MKNMLVFNFIPNLRTYKTSKATNLLFLPRELKKKTKKKLRVLEVSEFIVFVAYLFLGWVVYY